MIRVLRAADRIAAPWKNGGGITREVAIWPQGASLDDFDWRVSIAEVRESGPFSRFENIDRTMAILTGAITLTFADRTIELDARSEPLSFPGDVACEGAPRGGPVTDLNVMVRRGRICAGVRSVSAGEHALETDQTLVVATAPSRLGLASQAVSLNLLDAVLIEKAPEAKIFLEGAAVFITFQRQQLDCADQ